jgi:hypothetical protein
MPMLKKWRRRFWVWAHDALEAAWHWVYYNKLAEPLPPYRDRLFSESYTYVNSRTGDETPPRPIP